MFDFLKKSSKSAADKDDRKAEQYIRNVMTATGWDYDCAKREMLCAKKNFAVSYRDYDLHKFYRVSAVKQAAKNQEILKNREVEKRRKRAAIRNVMEMTGWDKETAVREMDDAKQRIGISYRDYSRFAIFNFTKDEQEAAYRSALSKAAKRKERLEKKREKFIHEVMEATGWSYDEAVAHMDHATKISGAEYKDYVAFKFWEIPDELQATYFTKGDSNALRAKYNTSKKNTYCFMNKNEFNEIFSDYLGRPWSYNHDISLEEFTEKFKNERKIMYKPLSASCGKGICAYDITEESIKGVYEELKELPLGIVEGYITQDPVVSQYSLNSVNTVRVVTVRKDDKVHLVFGVFRMAGGDAVVDNFHNGGVLAVVDIDTGEVVTDAVDVHGNKYIKHPCTDKVIKGFVIPRWEQVVDLLQKAGMLVDGVGYVGWDVAITEKGPVLIEGNTAPAPILLQLPYAAEHKGMKHKVTPFL